MSSVIKGIVDEGEEVAVIYIDGKPSVKYARKHEAEADAARMREKHPNRKIEIKHEVRETEAKKGADGKRCWKGKRYAGTVNGKDKCIPVKNEGMFDRVKKPTKKDGMRERLSQMSTDELRQELKDYAPRVSGARASGSLVGGAVADYVNAIKTEINKRAFNDFTEKNPNWDKGLGEAANPAQQAAIAISKKKKGEKPKNVTESYLAEGKLLIEARVTRKLWESAGQKLVEAQLTQDQIMKIFQDVEQGVSAVGGNRTMLGKGKDAASAVNKAWEDLKGKIQNTGPIQNMDAMYDKAAEAMKNATGGDQGAMAYVQKYRDFAKKHPVAQSFLYAALIAAAGLSGAGAGGAAALGLLKMTDRLLQGDKFSSALYKGGKTGAIAYGAGKIGQNMKAGDAQPGAPKPSADQLDAQGYPKNVGDMDPATAADHSQYQPTGGTAQPGVDARGYPTNIGDADPATAAEHDAWYGKGGKKTSNESVLLTKRQIFNAITEAAVQQRMLSEGVMDTVKGLAGKAGQWAKTKGSNLTNKVTADKLVQAWKKAGSSTDSEEVRAVLQDAGVDDKVISAVLPAQAAAQAPSPAAQPAATATTQAGQPAATSTGATTPSQQVAAAKAPTVAEINAFITTLKRKELEELKKMVEAFIAAKSKGKAAPKTAVAQPAVQEGVIVGHDKDDPEVAILGGAGTMSLSRLKKKAEGEAQQLAQDIASGKYNASSYNMKQLHNTLNTIAAAEEEMKKLYFGEDYTGEFAAEKTAAVNPYGGLKDRKFRSAIGEAIQQVSETPDTSGPVGVQPGGWRRTDKPEINEEELVEAKMFDVVRPLVKAFNLENGADERWASVSPLSPSASSPRRWRRGDGSYYTDPSKIISLSDEDKGLQKEFFSWLTQQPGVQPAGKIRGEFRSSDYSDAVKYKGLIFIDRGVYTEFTTPSRLRNAGVWNQKTDEDTSFGTGMGQGGNAGESYRKFKPKSAGTFKESAIMKGITGRK